MYSVYYAFVRFTALYTRVSIYLYFDYVCVYL